MPTVNIYSNRVNKEEIKKLSLDLKPYVANKLTCGDIKLSPEEVSIRVLYVEDGSMIGKVELEIKAHAFKERIEKQDKICNEIRNYIMEKYTTFGDIRVWLVLSELGHSW